MKEKTAMQILLKDLENFKVFPFVDKATIGAAIDFTKLRLADEKKQIVEAYYKGAERNGGHSSYDDKNSENYYSDKFED